MGNASDVGGYWAVGKSFRAGDYWVVGNSFRAGAYWVVRNSFRAGDYWVVRNAEIRRGLDTVSGTGLFYSLKWFSEVVWIVID